MARRANPEEDEMAKWIVRAEQHAVFTVMMEIDAPDKDDARAEAEVVLKEMDLCVGGGDWDDVSIRDSESPVFTSVSCANCEVDPGGEI